jgi:hypothetical protein
MKSFFVRARRRRNRRILRRWSSTVFGVKFSQQRFNFICQHQRSVTEREKWTQTHLHRGFASSDWFSWRTCKWGSWGKCSGFRGCWCSAIMKSSQLEKDQSKDKPHCIARRSRRWWIEWKVVQFVKKGIEIRITLCGDYFPNVEWW